jgi:predicted GNAT superfamily acetyltransferase
MTDLPASVGTAQDLAVEAADAAASSAGAAVRNLRTRDEFDEVCGLLQSIWRPDAQNPPVTAELLTALVKAGNYVAGAYQADVLIGACVGFFAAPTDSTLHSHIAGVSSAVRGRNVGLALKLHQRAWALQRRITTISWTFDPLVRRNAYFNLVKLAVQPVEYLPDFYGAMHDDINGGDATDRLLVRWDLDERWTPATHPHARSGFDAAALRADGAVEALGISADGRPIPSDIGGSTVLIAVPADVEKLRTVELALAKQWRQELRAALGTLLAGGARVIGFDPNGWYVVSTGDAATPSRD